MAIGYWRRTHRLEPFQESDTCVAPCYDYLTGHPKTCSSLLLVIRTLYHGRHSRTTPTYAHVLQQGCALYVQRMQRTEHSQKSSGRFAPARTEISPSLDCSVPTTPKSLSRSLEFLRQRCDQPANSLDALPIVLALLHTDDCKLPLM